MTHRARLAGLLVLALACPRAGEAILPGARDPLPLDLPAFRVADEAATTEFEATAAWRALLAESGEEALVWLDACTGAPGLARLRVPLVPGTGNRLGESDVRLREAFEADPAATVAAATLAFVARHARVLGVDPHDLVLDERGPSVLHDGRLVTVILRHAPRGIPVHEGGVQISIVRGNLVQLETRYLAPGTTLDPTTRLLPEQAREVAAAHVPAPEAPTFDDPGTLVWLPRAAGAGIELRLTWRVGFTHASALATWEAFVDARTGELLALRDRSLYACPPDARARAEVRGGIVPKYRWLPEVVTGMPAGEVQLGMTVETDEGGLYSYPGGAGSSVLVGSRARVVCTPAGCRNPSSALAPVDTITGDADHGTGGIDQEGNGLSHLSERTTFWHVTRVAQLARKWIADANIPLPMTANVNNPMGTCNGVFAGNQIYLLVAGGGCNNTGEVPGVIQHEWGHGLDARNGMSMGNWGEGCADAVDWLTNRYSGTAPAFYVGSMGGLRQMDEAQAGILRVWPAPECGGETHCLGEVYGQAAWHLGVLLRGDARFGEETGWHLSEALFFTSLSTASNLEPDVPGSLYTAYGTALDALFGDGDLMNGVPLASHLNAAFAHHGMASRTPYAEQAYPCATAPVAPVPGAQVRLSDPVTERPSVTLTWTDTFGGVPHDVLRSETGASHSKLELATVPSGTTTYSDRTVRLGATYHYAVLPQLPSGCYARMDTLLEVVVDPQLDLDSVAVDTTGDGAWMPGEQVQLVPTVLNLSGTRYPPGDPATNVVATIEPGDPRATLVQPTASIGNIPAASARSGGSWTVALANDATLCGATLTFPVRLSSFEGCFMDSWSVVVGVGAATPAVESVAVDDASGNGNGAPEPGETVDLRVRLSNGGPGDATGLQGTLSSLDPLVTIIDPTAAWPDIAAGAAADATDTFTVTLDRGVPCGRTVTFTLDLLGNGCWQVTFDLRAFAATVETVHDDLESPPSGWSVSNGALGGGWQWTDPLPLDASGTPVAPDDDVTAAPGHLAWVTETVNAVAGDDDVDSGCVVLVSPSWDVRGLGSPRIEYWRFIGIEPVPGAGGGDFVSFEVSADGGFSFQTLEVARSTEAWRRVGFDLEPLFGVVDQVQLRATACDFDPDSLVEAAVDEVRVVGVRCDGPTREPELRATSWLSDDGAVAGSGNGDGILEPGETVAVRVRLENVGLAQARNVVGTLTLPGAPAGATVAVSSSTWPDLDAAAGDVSVTWFEVALADPDFACGTPLDLRLDFTYDGDAGSRAGAAAARLETGDRVPGPATADAYFDDVDGTSTIAWLHHALAGEDDWQAGSPGGRAGDAGFAFSGRAAWGTDLGVPDGRFNWDGEAPIAGRSRLETWPLDLSGFAGVHLELQRWLTVEDAARDHARVLVNGAVVWENPTGSDFEDTDWVAVDLDISGLADRNASVVVAFEIETDDARSLGGWNLDDVRVVGTPLVPECGCHAPAPVPVGPALRVSKQAGAAQLDWSLSASAGPSYRVYRTGTPGEISPVVTILPTADGVASTSWLEPDPGALEPLSCYLVHALNACGVEE
jgi:hypothetical protein